MSDKKKKHVVYHYTDKKSAVKIQQTGYIKESKDTARDARYGPGVYATALRPNRSNKTLAQNNYDGIRVSQSKKDKFDVALECHIPKDKIKKVNDKDGRDIFLHQGNISMDYVKKIHYRQPEKK